MRLHLGGVERAGSAIDARNIDIDAAGLLAEIRDPDSAIVSCPRPGLAFEHVERIGPTTTISRRTAMAAAARSRGQSTSFDDEIRDIHTELAEIHVPAVDVPAALSTVAEAGETVESLRDRVARLGGVVAASDDADVEVDGDAMTRAQSSLRTAAAELADAETTLHAARQELARERERQRAANDARERRLELEDRLGNLRRDARGELVDREATRLSRALDAVPDWPHATADARLALAIARNAAVRAPIVVESGPFRTAGQARACLAAPVVLL